MIFRLLCVAVLLITVCSLVGCGEEELPEELPEGKSLEDVQGEIDNLFLEEQGANYYGSWLLLESSVNEIEDYRISLGITEEKGIAYWVGLVRESSNWLDLGLGCFEMSALTECLFEQIGFNSLIIVSDELGHAWVVIETSDGDNIPVEPMGMFVVTPDITVDDMTYEDYLYKGEALFDIYEAEYFAPGEFDWWNSVESLEQLKWNQTEVGRYTNEWFEKQEELLALAKLSKVEFSETEWPEDIPKEIDSLFLEEEGTTYYGNWMFSKSDVRELEEIRVESGISEEEWIGFWVDSLRETSNWSDLYTEDVFDCSEMSALAECLFEQLGFESAIVVSDELEHAWVYVKKSDGCCILIEATWMSIITPETASEDITYEDYFLKRDFVFANIYQAEFVAPGEFDWWNSVESLEQLEYDEAEMDRFTEEWFEARSGG